MSNEERGMSGDTNTLLSSLLLITQHSLLGTIYANVSIALRTAWA